MKYLKISYIDILTPFGHGLDHFFRQIVKGKRAFSKNKRFDCSPFRTDIAALIPGISIDYGTCVEQMFDILLPKTRSFIPKDTRLIFASTVGEIENLGVNAADSTLLNTALKLKSKFDLKKNPYVISAACASVPAAIDRAKSLIQSGKEQLILIASADSISEFVFSGFSALMVLDSKGARPFDRDRNGLTLGEAAGILLLEPDHEKKKDTFYILGSGSSSDANHITSPCRDGEGLAIAIRKAIRSAELKPDDIDFIVAHGTGTKYNDSSELKAYKSVFSKPCPVFSVKGAVGHTLGNAGVLQIAAAIEAIKNSLIPLSVGFINLADEAKGWICEESLMKYSKNALIVNAGFGGINGALVISRG